MAKTGAGRVVAVAALLALLTGCSSGARSASHPAAAPDSPSAGISPSGPAPGGAAAGTLDAAAAEFPPTCRAKPAVGDLQPASGAWFGVNLDWSRDSVASYSRRLGHRPAVAVDFVPMPLDGRSAAYMDQAAVQIRSIGAAMMLTVQPASLAAVTPAAVADLTKRVALFNRDGIPVFLRFAQEMNGTWYPWGQQPTGYVAAFRRVADAVHAADPLTRMVWAPNYGGGYPFSAGRYAARPGTADFARLDTNGDHTLTEADDPYGPYWPGDRYVDWVGISLYDWGNHYPWGANAAAPADAFASMLTGTYEGPVGDQRDVPDLYAFAVAHGKPLAVTETAAFYSPGHGGDALAIKSDWWRQAFGAVASGRFPDLQMLNWFEWNKYETEVQAPVEWAATTDPAQAAAFRQALPATLRYAGSWSVCQG